jgi:hypothetical protein
VQALTGESPSVEKSAPRALELLAEVLDADVLGLDAHTPAELLA